MRRIILLSLSLFLLFTSVVKAGVIYNPQDIMLGVSTSNGKDVRAFYFDSATNDWEAGTDVILGGPSTSNATDVRLFCYDDGDWTACTDPADIFTSNWGFEDNFGAPSLTPTSTIPVWFKAPVYASSTLQVVGDALFESDLTVQGTLTTAYLTVNQNQTSNIVWGDGNNNASSTWALLGNGNLGLSSTTTNPIMTWTNDGMVGIGTANPTSALDINFNAASIALTSPTNARTNITANSPRTATDAVILRYRGLWDGNAVAHMDIVTGDDTGNKDDGYFTFDVSEGGVLSEAMRIEQNGNVGIGTTTPETKLQVFGNSALISTDFDGASNSAGFATYYQGGYKGSIQYVGPSHGTVARRDTLEIQAGGVATDITFLTTGAAEKMRIQQDGNVGIGTTAPDELLHLLSSVSSKPVLKLENTNTNALGNWLEFYKNTSAGNIADNDLMATIGFYGNNDAGTPEKIQYSRIESWLEDFTDGTEDGAIDFSSMNNGTLRSAIRILGAETVINESGVDRDLRVEASGVTNALFVEGSSGNVGIGTTAPNALLHVDGTSEFEGIINTNNNWISGDGGSEGISVDSTGRVGIGTTTPSAMLTVNGIIQTEERSSATCDASTEGGIYYDSDDSHFYGCNGSSWVQLDN